MSLADKIGSFLTSKARGYQKHCIGSVQPGLKKLILTDYEILTENRNIYHIPDLTDILQFSAEIADAPAAE